MQGWNYVLRSMPQRNDGEGGHCRFERFGQTSVGRAQLFSFFAFLTRGRHYVSCMPVDTSVTGTLQEGPASRAMALALSAFKGERRLPRSRRQPM